MLDRGHDFFDIVFLALFDVVRLPEYFGRIRLGSVFTRSVWFEERDMEDIVYLPLAGKRDAYC